jgi:hypothetical protein
LNERIKQLAEQAGAETWSRAPMRAVTGLAFTDENLEKFAQLMVFECVNAVMDGTKEGDHYAQRIEQHFDNGPGGILHFGVEE